MNWFAVLVAAVVVVALFFIWRLFGTAGKGINAMAGTASEAIGAVRPIADGVGHVIQGVGEGIHAFVDSMRKKQAELGRLTADNASMKSQIEQLKARQVTATAIERQLQVAFFSIKTKYTSFKSVTLGTEAGGLLGLERPTRRDYVGIIDAHFTAKVGVDLKKLRFGLKRDSNVVYVQGAHEVQNIGSKDLKLTEPFAEIRTVYEETGARRHAIEVLPPGKELIEQTAIHRGEVLAEAQNSALASSLAEANEKVAIGFFKAIIGGGRFEFVPKADVIDQPLTFEELCEEINGSIASQIESLEAKCRELDARALALDEEILQTALGARGVVSGTARLN